MQRGYGGQKGESARAVLVTGGRGSKEGWEWGAERELRGKDTGRCGEMRGDAGRCGEMRGDTRRCGELRNGAFKSLIDRPHP
jgi:hypothetical protein